MYIENIIQHIKQQQPLIHAITNYVTANDVANIILAIGASPIMADEVLEIEDITSMAQGLDVNLGTINQNRFAAIKKAGMTANQKHIPILLDPVGIGASRLRQQYVEELLEYIQFDVIRGNISEIKALYQHSKTKGVDANSIDQITKDNIEQVVCFVKEVAKTYHCIIAVSSAIDVIADEAKAYVIYNGHPMMSRITGSGCMLSGLCTAFMSVNQQEKLDAIALAFMCHGIAGEKAYERMENNHSGNATYRNDLIDAIYLMSIDDIKEKARYEIY
ncbi:MAG: hydroxyethylthiazole kinase [Erysipelotrichaceae bacterium]|nr:hydroxyethylthiazole kinase [Erysipelotrichaceae bacterium]